VSPHTFSATVWPQRDRNATSTSVPEWSPTPEQKARKNSNTAIHPLRPGLRHCTVGIHSSPRRLFQKWIRARLREVVIALARSRVHPRRDQHIPVRPPLHDIAATIRSRDPPLVHLDAMAVREVTAAAGAGTVVEESAESLMRDPSPEVPRCVPHPPHHQASSLWPGHQPATVILILRPSATDRRRAPNKECQ
jgi:hypothetical protein